MKKVFGFVFLAIFAASLFTSCTPYKQTCAAYNNVDFVDDAVID